MNSIKYLFSVLLFSLAFTTIAAEIPSDIDSGIKGKIIDKSNRQALEYATIMVYNQSDTSFVAGSISGPKGDFNIELKPGNYMVSIQFLAYATINLDNVVVSRSRMLRDLGDLFISPDSEMLEEIEVIAERSTVEMTLDKRVFNIGKDLSSKAGNAIEVLENIPSVTVDIEGNVSLRGDEGVRILVDGKVSGLAGLSDKNALRSISSDMIERIEVVTNPSVRYDAEGTSGIINIVLKKDKRRGFNGSVDVTTGYPLQAGLGLNANYRLDKVNLFATYNINYRENVGGGDSYRRFDFETPYETYQDSESKRTSFGNTFRFGAEYLITPNNSLTLSMMYRHANMNNLTTVLYNDYRPATHLINESERITDQSNFFPNLQYSADYRKQFKRKDQLFTASLQYYDSKQKGNSTIIEQTIFNVIEPYPDPLYQWVNNDEVDGNLQFQADYFHPFGGKAKLETGFKFQNRTIDNDYRVEEEDELTGDRYPLSAFTNHFVYDENIYAAYALFGNDVGRYSYQVGLRSEYSQISTILRETQEENKNNYIDLFPSAHFTYKLTEQDNIQFSYSRRIRRPGFWQLNPFRTLNDNRNIMTGNPNLKPVYTNAFETGYLRYWKNASVNANIYYRHSTDVFQRIERVERVDSTLVTFARPENFAKNDSYGLELIGMYSLSKIINLNGSLNFFRSMTQGEAYGVFYETDNYSWWGRLQSKFTVAKSFDLQLAGNYRGKMSTPQGSRLPGYSVDLGLSKDVLSDRGTLTLNVRDVFNTRKHAMETFGPNFYSSSNFRWSTTTITLNFNYRINQQKKRNGERRQQMMDDEEQMMDM